MKADFINVNKENKKCYKDTPKKVGKIVCTLNFVQRVEFIISVL